MQWKKKGQCTMCEISKDTVTIDKVKLVKAVWYNFIFVHLQ